MSLHGIATFLIIDATTRSIPTHGVEVAVGDDDGFVVGVPFGLVGVAVGTLGQFIVGVGDTFGVGEPLRAFAVAVLPAFAVAVAVLPGPSGVAESAAQAAAVAVAFA